MRDLYIWSQEHPVDLAPIKAAKAKLALDFQVRPVAVTEASDLPAWESRVLAIGSRPPFLCDYALTTPRTSEEGWLRAVVWVLGRNDDPKATYILDTLTAAFGPGVREISPEEQEARQRLREYQGS